MHSGSVYVTKTLCKNAGSVIFYFYVNGNRRDTSTLLNAITAIVLHGITIINKN